MGFLHSPVYLSKLVVNKNHCFLNTGNNANTRPSRSTGRVTRSHGTAHQSPGSDVRLYYPASTTFVSHNSFYPIGTALLITTGASWSMLELSIVSNSFHGRSSKWIGIKAQSRILDMHSLLWINWIHGILGHARLKTEHSLECEENVNTHINLRLLR